MDISTHHLKSYRETLSVIPQYPLLFLGIVNIYHFYTNNSILGTIRSNIDPGYISSDFQIWKILETIGLKNKIEKMKKQLNTQGCLTDDKSILIFC